MVTASGIVYIFNRCKEYGQLSQLLNACADTKTKDLLYKEFASFARLNSVGDKIVNNIVYLHYWGGTIAGPVFWACELVMQEARMRAYQNMIDFVLHDGVLTGVFPSSAKKVYQDCVFTSLAQHSDYSPYENLKLYDEQRTETTEKLQLILPMIDEWSKNVALLNHKLTTDGSEHLIERNAANILITFAAEATWY